MTNTKTKCFRLTKSPYQAKASSKKSLDTMRQYLNQTIQLYSPRSKNYGKYSINRIEVTSLHKDSWQNINALKKKFERAPFNFPHVKEKYS